MLCLSFAALDAHVLVEFVDAHSPTAGFTVAQLALKFNVRYAPHVAVIDIDWATGAPLLALVAHKARVTDLLTMDDWYQSNATVCSYGVLASSRRARTAACACGRRAARSSTSCTCSTTTTDTTTGRRPSTSTT